MAYEFNGTSQLDWSTHVADFDGATSFTLSWWYYPLSTTGSAFGKHLSQINGSNFGFSVFSWFADNSRFAVGVQNGSNLYALMSTAPFATPNVWYHCFVAWNGTVADVYANGVYMEQLSLVGTVGTCTDGFDMCGIAGNRLDARIAEAAAWANLYVTDASVPKALAAGFSPLSVLRTKPTVYFPLVADANDVMGRAGSPTATGSPTIVPHVPVRRPRGVHVAAKAAVVAGTWVNRAISIAPVA